MFYCHVKYQRGEKDRKEMNGKKRVNQVQLFF